MIQHCIAAFELYSKEQLYRAYITDTLKAIADNTMQFIVPNVGAVEYGTKIQTRWIELERTIPTREPEKEKVEDTRSCSEIANDMWTRIRGDKEAIGGD